MACAALVRDSLELDGISRASVEAGIGPWTVADVTAPAELRLYRADVTEAKDADLHAVLSRVSGIGAARPCRS